MFNMKLSVLLKRMTSMMFYLTILYLQNFSDNFIRKWINLIMNKQKKLFKKNKFSREH